MKIKLETLGDLHEAPELIRLLGDAAERSERTHDLRGQRILITLRAKIREALSEQI